MALINKLSTDKNQSPIHFDSTTFINFENAYNADRFRTEVRKSLDKELREIDGVLGRMLEG